MTKPAPPLQIYPPLQSQLERVNQILSYASHVRQIGSVWNVPHISCNTAHFLQQLLQGIKPQRILEVGTATGYSALQMLAACWADNTEITSLDFNTPSSQRAALHVSALGLENRINIIYGNALQTLPTLAVANYDFVFIDAEKKHSQQFLQLCLPLCTTGATIVIDDVIKFGYKMTGLQDYVDRLVAQRQLTSKLVSTDHDDGIMLLTLCPQANW